MASVDKRLNGQWRARWREYPGGPQKTRHFARKVDAEQYLVKVQHDMLTGVYIDPGKLRTTVRDVYEVWRARQSWRPRTRLTAEGDMKNHFLPRFGDRPVGSVRRGDLEAWAAGLTLAPSTIRLVMQYVSSMFAAAVTDGFIPSNPATGAKLPKVDSAPIVPPTTDEVLALQSASPGWFAISTTLGAGIGLRQGEATGLTVDRVDFLRREARIDRQLAPIPPAPGEPIGFSPPKTKNGYRTIPLAAWVLDDLARHIEQYGTGELGLILHRDGHPVRRSTFGETWRKTRTKAKLETRFHDTRHFFASTLLSRGVGVAAVAKYMGDTPAVVLSTYAHLIPDDNDRARQAMDAAFSGDRERPAETLAGDQSRARRRIGVRTS